MTQSFEPSAEQRRTVQVLSGIGVPQEQIAIIVGIDAKTLRKAFRDDLDRGMAEATTKVAQTLFGMATRGDNTAATIFWMKARAGWREKHEVLTDQDPLLDVLERLRHRARAAHALPGSLLVDEEAEREARYVESL